jgi:hypothetical protein
MAGLTTLRGYGSAHQKLRQAMSRIVMSGGAYCPHCRRLIIPGEPWDLDHTDDRSGYRGAAHRSCNRAAGARKGNRSRGLIRKGARVATGRASRRW